MNKKYAIGLLVAVNVLSIFAAGNVMAGESQQKWNYGQLKVGMMGPTGDIDDADYDLGVDYSVAYGRYLTPNLVVEGALNGFAVGMDSRGSNNTAGSYKQENVLSAGAALLTLKGEYAIGPVDIFAGIGGGVYAVTLTSDIESSRLGDFSADDSDVVLGGHVVAGANYNITDRFFVGVEALYRMTGDVDMRETVATIPVSYKGDLNGYAITVNGGFRF